MYERKKPNLPKNRNIRQLGHHTDQDPRFPHSLHRELGFIGKLFAKYLILILYYNFIEYQCLVNTQWDLD